MVRLGDKATKATPVDADSLAILDSEDTVASAQKVKRLTFAALATWLLGKFLAWFGLVLGNASGMVADLATGTASIASGTAALTGWTGTALTSADVGKTVTIRNAGGASIPLITTILAVTSGTTATLAATASATVSGEYASTGTDNRAALAALAAVGARAYVFLGSYLVTASLANTAKDAAVASLQASTLVLGIPFLTRFHFVGSTNTTLSTNYFAHLFRVNDGVSRVAFCGLEFTSDNGDGDTGFAHVLNNQAGMIDILLSTASDVWVVGCLFRNLWGFPAHERGGVIARVFVLGNWLRHCANGLNVNASYSIQICNYIEDSEGFEVCGECVIVACNLIRDAWGVGISTGGRVSAGLKLPQIVALNLIDGVTKVGSTAVGILVTESAVGTLVAANLVRRAAVAGIAGKVTTGGILNQWNAFIGNACYSNGLSTEISRVGMDLNGTGRQFAIANACFDAGLTGYDQQFGLVLRTPRSVALANFLDGTLYDLYLAATATTAHARSNVLANNLVLLGAGGTLASHDRALRAPLAKSASYTMTLADLAQPVLVNCNGAGRTVTLLAAATAPGQEVTIKKTDAGAFTVTVAVAGAETIDGAASYALATQYKYVRVLSDGTNWQIVGGN